MRQKTSLRLQKKYNRLFKKLQQALQSGQFLTYSSAKKTALLSRLQRYENRLLRRGVAVLGTAALLMSGGEVLAQQPVRVGEEFRVNSYTEGLQGSVSMAMDSDGDFIVVWLSEEQDEGYYDGVYGQRYNEYGEKLGNEFKINSDTLFNSEEVFPSVAMDDDGNFVVVWGNYISKDEKYFHVYGQRFSSEGTKVNEKFQVSTDSIEYIEFVSVAMDDDGDFAVVWDSALNYSSTFNTIVGQIYDKSGDKIGNEFKIVDEKRLSIYNSLGSNIAMDSDGDFAVTWTSYREDDSTYTSVYANIYHKDGTIKKEIEVTENIVGLQALPTIAMNDNGDFVVVWVNASKGDDSVNIYGRKFDHNGNATADEFKVNTFENGYESFPKVDIDNEGDFITTWVGEDENEDFDYSIYARIYNNIAVPFGDEFTINNQDSREQFAPMVKMNDEDGFVMIWHEEGEDGEADIFGQLFSLSAVSTTNQYSGVKECIISPNPVQNQLQIQLQNDIAHSAELKILSLDGKVLLEQQQSLFKGQNELNLNVKQLAAGTYFLQILTKKGVEQVKFVKL